MKTTGKRNYGIDLLRIVSMSMIVMLHTLSRSKLLDIDQTTLKYAFVWFLEIFSYCAVNCFVLISGYVGVHSKFRVSRILGLWVQVAFYSVLFEVIHQLHTQSFDLLKLVTSFAPVSMKAYWFFTCYFLLSLFMPFINHLVKTINRRQRWMLAILLFVCYSVVPMLMTSPLPVIGDRTVEYVSSKGGYSVLWLCIMYAYGAILRLDLDEKPVSISRIKTAVGFALCVLVTWAFWCGRIHFTSIGGKAWYMVSYTAPLVVLAAVFLLLLFKEIPVGKLAQPLVNIFSASAFSVYLVHSHPRVYEHYVEFVKPLLPLDGRQLLLWLPVTILVVYLVCTVIDLVRSFVFKHCGIDRMIKKVDTVGFIKAFEDENR